MCTLWKSLMNDESTLKNISHLIANMTITKAILLEVHIKNPLPNSISQYKTSISRGSFASK